MKPVLAMLEKSTADYVPEETALVKPGEHSRYGLNVPRIIFTIGSPENMFRNLPKILPRIIRSVINRMIGYKSLSRNPDPPKTVADQGLINELKSYALSLGCQDIGFKKLDNNLVFSNKNVLYPNAIVLTMNMNKKSIARAPEIASGKEVWRTYDRLGIIVNRCCLYEYRESARAIG